MQQCEIRALFMVAKSFFGGRCIKLCFGILHFGIKKYMSYPLTKKPAKKRTFTLKFFKSSNFATGRSIVFYCVSITCSRSSDRLCRKEFCYYCFFFHFQNPEDVGTSGQCYTPQVQSFRTCHRKVFAAWGVGGGVSICIKRLSCPTLTLKFCMC